MKSEDFRDDEERETVVDLEKGKSSVEAEAVVGINTDCSSSSGMKEDRNNLGLASGVKISSVSKNEMGGNEGTSNGGGGVGFKNDGPSVVLSLKNAQLSRDSSSHEQCRVCQQDKDEVLIVLGCQCRGDLGKAHRSCIDTWFRTKGSNTCEICQQIAVNVPPPQSHPTASYWVWRVDPAFRGGNTLQERPRGGFSPLWVGFSILIGGLLLDILISITLGVSALPVNIIIGVIVVLGFGTALRLAIEFFQDWNARRVVQRTDTNVHFGYNAAV